MSKVIFRISIICLVFWVISPILLYLVGLEFNNDGFEQTYKKIRFFGVPICILLTLFGTIKPNDNSKTKISKSILTVGVTILAFFFMVLTVVTSMCDWTNLNVLYVNIENEDLQIIERDYGCGALDSGPQTNKIFTVKKFTKYFILTREIEVENIDQSKWMSPK